MLRERKVRKMILLFEGRNRVTSCYRCGDRPDHRGIDIVGDDSKDILCPVDGTVRSSTIIVNRSDPTWEWGNYVRVDDADGNRYFFCHMASRAVTVGQKVKAGDKLGVMGSTGKSAGAHTHFEIRKPDGKADVDPAAFLGIPNKKGTYQQETGWVQKFGLWYWYADGKAVKSQWLHEGGYWYYLGSTGAMLTGLQEIDGKLYMLNPKRAHDIPTGACIITDGKGVIGDG